MNSQNFVIQKNVCISLRKALKLFFHLQNAESVSYTIEFYILIFRTTKKNPCFFPWLMRFDRWVIWYVKNVPVAVVDVVVGCCCCCC